MRRSYRDLGSAGESLQVKGAEVDIFLKGGGALDINSVRKKPKVSLHSSPDLWIKSLLCPCWTIYCHSSSPDTIIRCWLAREKGLASSTDL